MDENKVREIIREELGQFLKSDRFAVYKTMQFLDGRNVQLGQTTGTKIGIATTDKLGFWAKTPVIQQANAAQAAVVTTGATQTTPWGYSTEAQANAIVTLVNRLRLDLVTTGIIKGSS